MVVAYGRPALRLRDFAPGIVALVPPWTGQLHARLLSTSLFYVLLTLTPQNMFAAPRQWPPAASVPLLGRCARGRLQRSPARGIR